MWSDLLTISVCLIKFMSYSIEFYVSNMPSMHVWDGISVGNLLICAYKRYYKVKSKRKVLY